MELGKSAVGGVSILAALDTAALAVEDELDLIAQLVGPVDVRLIGVIEILEGSGTGGMMLAWSMVHARTPV